MVIKFVSDRSFYISLRSKGNFWVFVVGRFGGFRYFGGDSGVNVY